MVYVYIGYIPGSCGNFLSRAISLCSDVYGDIPPNTKIDDLTRITPTEKLEFLAYRTELHIDSEFRKNNNQWRKHETALKQTTSLFTLDQLIDILPKNSFLIRHGHPCTDEKINQNFAGVDDNEHTVLITIDDMLEWVMCNAMCKCNSLTREYFNGYSTLISTPKLIKVNLKRFLTTDDFLEMYVELCSSLNINSKNIHLDKVELLHRQWIHTVISVDAFKEKYKL